VLKFFQGKKKQKTKQGGSEQKRNNDLSNSANRSEQRTKGTAFGSPDDTTYAGAHADFVPTRAQTLAAL
jgi:hypothetical protein